MDCPARTLKHAPSMSKGPASGVRVDEDCISSYNQMKKRGWQYIIFKLTDDFKEVVVEEKASRGKSFGDFVNSLKRAELLRQCRYAVFDVEYHFMDMKREKFVFYMWCPECANVRQKMLYTSTKDTLKKKLNGLAFEMQSTDDSELGYAALLEKCLERSR